MNILFTPVLTFYALAFNVRLTKQNEGYIEIKTGSNWKTAADKNWNRKRRNKLCLLLGLEAIKTKEIETRKTRTGQQIIRGDLIFYSTQQGVTSSCVNLKPFTSTTNINAPYVKCKCDLW